MTNALTHFPPTHAEARARLEQFAPSAAGQYARTRNFDYGPGQHDNVSTLSPYVKVRMLDEITVTRAVLSQHKEADAEKFIAEVFWRSYWKGWLELRPAVWTQYMNDLIRLRDDIQTQSGLRTRWEEACTGQTGIAPFDAWAQELQQTGYLHNHARMWFASIWIFTLDLPWQLGADFFLRHLLDGDAAVNTLSWRWVAGIQTQGKTYLATAENIAKFTDGRFPNVTNISDKAIPCEAPKPVAAGMLPPCDPLPLSKRYGILLHGDDIDVDRLLLRAKDPVAFAYADATAGHTTWQMAPHVGQFRASAAQGAVPADAEMQLLSTAQSIADWASQHNMEQIVAPYAPVGPMRDMLTAYRAIDGAVPLSLFRRPLDSAAWPHATKGFFPFRKHIPALIGEFVRR
ncbi:DNA photolyase [Sulfitobacter sp. JBTF-M27]|uniref:DNA photolyase n=1 Tax=Sulfitobacter sediminilitoris TaxID=2698830 RepID=A0A6P0CA17_9RHOB|nr:FAD-binding domain-containing protein [Sulfitobacter sediminilitoris]NEK21966.1 DNA photolyase [Sulfitobacter sediminilitoris]